MRNIEEIEKDIQALQDEAQVKIYKLKKELEEAKKIKKSRWKPEITETYWYIGNDYLTHISYRDDIRLINYRYNNHNCFKTQEEAREYLAYQKALNEATYEFSAEEWNDENISKYFIYYSFRHNKIEICYDSEWRSIVNKYFKIKSEAQNFIYKYKKQILKFEFGIEEEN